MSLVYKINWFVNKISRGLRLITGIIAACVIVMLFIESNKRSATDHSIDNKIGQAIQRSVDSASIKVKQLIHTINPSQ